MINGRKSRAFLDSGSTISLISEKYTNELGIVFDSNHRIPITGISGSTKTLGRAHALVTIGKISREIPIDVVGGFEYDLLIGNPHAGLYGLVTHHQTCQLRQELGSVEESVNCGTDVANFLDPSHPVYAQYRIDIGRVIGTEHVIRLKEDTSPIALRPYRHSPAINAEINRQVNELLNQGVIRPSVSPWSFR